MRSKPNIGIIAPINSSIPAVENKPTVDFEDTLFSDRQTKKEATIRKIHATTRRTIIGPRKGTMSAGFTFWLTVKF